MNEDYTALNAVGEKILESSKVSDVTTFSAVATEALEVAKDQCNTGNSPHVQPISAKIKQSKKP